MVDIVWKSYNPEAPSRGYWDMALLDDLFAADYFVHHDNPDKWPSDGAVVIIPARSHYDYIDQINADIKKLKWCLLILVGDEEAKFDLQAIKHKKMKKWIMLPRKDVYDKADFYIPNGYTPDTRPMLAQHRPVKKQDWFFAGQVTHQRREECVLMLRRLENGKLVETEGFTQGLPHEEYYKNMVEARLAPCPAGPESVDTFRLYEALEAGCIPVVDNKTPKEKQEYFWEMLFGPHPLTTVYSWDYFPGHRDALLENYQEKANTIFSWWLGFKKTMRDTLKKHLKELGGKIEDDITVLVPTSPIPSIPDTSIISETVESIRYHLPNAEIIIMVDGIREEQQEEYGERYQEYIRNVLWKCNHEWNCVAKIFDEHKHQAAMTRETLELVNTPLIMFVEHDTPLVLDYEIPFDEVSKTVLNGDANLVRFHFEAQIPKEHDSLMIGMIPGYMRTIQWSQRPHVASKVFYKRILKDHFSKNSRTMIEDIMHGVVIEEYKLNGIPGWNDYRIVIYHPEGNIKRSYHTDGRANDQKYDDKYIK